MILHRWERYFLLQLLAHGPLAFYVTPQLLVSFLEVALVELKD